MGWLFGALEGAGIQLPETFDLKGILSIVLQVLGLTYANIRARAVRMLGEETVSRLEQVAEVFKILVTEGPAGLWNMLVEKLGSIKDMLLEQIQRLGDREGHQGGHPLGGQPAQSRIRLHQGLQGDLRHRHVLHRARQADPRSGQRGARYDLGDRHRQHPGDGQQGRGRARASMIPVAISFLASLLGLGGISEKIREIIETIQKPVNAAIDWVIGKAVALVKAAGGFIKGLGCKKDEEKPKDKPPPQESDPEKTVKVEAGLLAFDSIEQQYIKDGRIEREDAEKVAATVKEQHPIFKSITVVDAKDRWSYDWHASPGQIKTGEKKSAADEILTITRIMERPGFRESTRETIPITRGEDRRHIDAWQAIHESLVHKLNGKTVKEAADIMTELKYPPSELTEATVLKAAKQCLRDQFNDPENLWPGDAVENQEKGRQFAQPRKKVDEAIATGDRALFEANLAIVEALWHDPDPTGTKKGFVGLVKTRVQALRDEFNAKWPDK